MIKKAKLNLNKATMQGLFLSPVLVVSQDSAKKSGINIITVSYVGVLSENPPIIGLAIRPGRHSYQLIKKAKEFSVNLPSREMLEIVDFCGTYSGKKVDKSEVLKLALNPGLKIKTPIIVEAPINLECQLIKVLSFPQHKASHEYFIGQVLAVRQTQGFNLETAQLLATTNYDYRLVSGSLGRAHTLAKQFK